MLGADYANEPLKCYNTIQHLSHSCCASVTELRVSAAAAAARSTVHHTFRWLVTGFSCMAWNTTSSAPWKALLQKSLAQNSSLPYAKYLQLATVRPDGRPANRTVVYRGFLYNTDHITIVTDRRSGKVAELAANHTVELCWYFPNSREQYRLSGIMDIVTEDHADKQLLQARQEAWARMSDAGRSQFVWPHPAQPRMPVTESLFLQPAPESAGPAVENFCLGVVQVYEVDHVDLYTNQRCQYRSQPAAAIEASTGSQDAGSHRPGLDWIGQSINP